MGQRVYISIRSSGESIVNELYSITDLTTYAEQMRNMAAKYFKEDHNENLDDYISLSQVYSIVRDEAVGLDEKDNFILDEESNEKIYDTVKVWLHNVGLAKLAASDLVECAWDDEINEMIFWVKEDTTKKNPKNEKPKSKNKRPKRKNT
jgi:hypothetical protein